MLAALAFLVSPIGRILAALGLGLALFVAGFAYGHHVADQSAEIAALKSQLGVAKFDARAAEELRQQAQAAAERLQENDASRSLQVNDYENTIAKLSDQTRTCRLATDDDVRRLRNLK